jgi:transcriptional regulator with XRE-family HTH domain/DNA-directed RNA polymerase subunit RPC12/RpoP
MIDQVKTGRFIAGCRKEKDLTQAQLAEMLGITDRAVSKWENGKSLPDAGTMVELCEILDISVNELLSGEKLHDRNYREMAELNLLELTKQEEDHNRKMLRLENVVGFIGTISFLLMCFTAAFAVQETPWRIGIFTAGFIILFAGVSAAVKIEQSAGYYECQNCHERYVPSMKAVCLAPHMGRTRYMKCPYCGKRTWQKKVLIK